MVYQIVNSRYRVFLEAFLIALIIILAGFLLGVFVENMRTNKVIDSYKRNEIQGTDLKLMNYYYQIMDRDACDSAIKKNFEFADDVYNTGLEIEKFENANQITDSIKLEKERYVLLKTELWLNTILLKEKCGDKFDTVVYFYSNSPGEVLTSQQKILSNVLKAVKEDKGDSIILIPIAGDIGLNIVDLQRRVYNITELPAILINEKVLLTGFRSAEEIETYLK